MLIKLQLMRFQQIFERVWYCWRNQHRIRSFTSFKLPGGNLRVYRCQCCAVIDDVNVLWDDNELGLAMKVVSQDAEIRMKLEDTLRTIPGYPAEPEFSHGERFR